MKIVFPLGISLMISGSGLAYGSDTKVSCKDKHSFKFAMYELREDDEYVLAKIGDQAGEIGELAKDLGLTTNPYQFSTLELKIPKIRCEFDINNKILLDCFETAGEQALLTDRNGKMSVAAINAVRLFAHHVITTTRHPNRQETANQIVVRTTLWRRDDGEDKTGTAQVEFHLDECQ